MSIWFFIWLILSATLLFFSFWTVVILMKQKKAWSVFAKRHDLRFVQGNFFEAPSVNGVYKTYPVSLFTGEHQQEDARKNRKLTAIEVTLNSEMPMVGAAASGGMIPLLDVLGHNVEYRPDHKAWKGEYVVRSDNLPMLMEYMTDKRIEALTTLMKVVNAWVMFIFMEEATLIRIDMPNPLEDPKKMDILLDKLVEVAAILELEEGEEKKIEACRDKIVKDNDAVISLDDSKGEGLLELELEEDEAEEVQGEPEPEPESKSEEDPTSKS